MDEPIGFSVKKFRDPRGMRNVFLFKDYKEIMRLVLQSRIKAQDEEQDTIYMTCGMEGTGKSTWNFHLLDVYEELTGKELTIEHVCRDLTELKQVLGKFPARSFITLDEGSELSSDRFAERNVKDLRERFTIMRKLSHLVVLCFTNPLKINTYFREDRFRGVFMCKKRGTVYYYAAENVLDILTRIKADMSGVKSSRLFLRYAPNFVMYNIPEYKGHLRKQYEERKDSNIEFKLDTDTIVPTNLLKLSEVARRIGVSFHTAKKRIESLDIPYTFIKGKRYIDIDGMNKLKKNEILKQDSASGFTTARKVTSTNSHIEITGNIS